MTKKKNGKVVEQRAPVERIERWPIERLTPYARNPRMHAPEQTKQIAASMQQFGQAQLVVVDEAGEIIAGHGRVLAAQQLGWKELAVGVAVGWSEAQRRAYRVADNQIGLTSAWDGALLRMEVSDLQFAGFDISLLAFDAAKLAAMLIDPTAPGAFPAVGDDLHTEHACPSCGYRWSGNAMAGEERADAKAGKKEEA